MKKAWLIALALVAFLTPSVYSAVTVATLGDQNSSYAYRVEVDSDGVVKFQTDTGIEYPYQYVTTSDTLVAAETGRTYLFQGTYNSEFELPACSASTLGAKFSFVSGTDKKIAVDPNGTDTIRYSVSSIPLDGGDKMLSPGATADSVTLFCGASGYWYVKDINGSWTDGGS